MVLYDTETLTPLPAAQQLGDVPESAAGLTIAYSADGNFLAVAFVRLGANGEPDPSAAPVRVWDLRAPEAPVAELTSDKQFNGVALAPDGAQVYLAKYPSGDVVAYDTATEAEVETREAIGGRLVASPDGTRLALTGLGDDGTVKILDAETLEVQATLRARGESALVVPGVLARRETGGGG